MGNTEARITAIAENSGDLDESLNFVKIFPTFVERCRSSKIGKLLPNALYVHLSALSALDPLLQAWEQRARQATPAIEEATLIKFSTEKPKISYLFYPTFDSDPHPALKTSVLVGLETLEASRRDYSSSDNPPILHRKETFITPDYPLYQKFAALTRQEEALGLLDHPRCIGTLQGWKQRLAAYQVELQEHCLVHQSISQSQLPKQRIERHKAAIARITVSKPARLAIAAGLFAPETTFFDYGCGYGADIEYLTRLGYASCGWDPYYRPDRERVPADIVNLSYVINVIEDTAERRLALIKAWDLTQKVLIVAAQVLVDDPSRGLIAYGDGVITSRNTFQKYYEQEELKNYINQVLGVDAIPVALGIYFVFRDGTEAESFRASRFRSRATTPRVQLSIKRFEDYQELLQPLMDFVTQRGRLPVAEESDCPKFIALMEEFGSLKRAFKIVLQATDAGEWEAITEKRRQDLLVYLALRHFGHRPNFKALASGVQNDIKSLFGSYQQACTGADLMLISLGNLAAIAERCRQSPIGQQHANSLWVHVSALEQLDPLLRLYEGCASRTIGCPEEATVIKFHAHKPRITYLFLPKFDADPHPALRTSMEIDLRDLQVRYRDYDRDNPPLLHQKEQILAPDYPGYQKFARLSQQEQRWGLLDDLGAIYNRQGWLECLENHGAQLRGYRLVWRKEID